MPILFSLTLENIILFSIFSTITLIDVTVISYYLQLKEYRPDRIRDFIRFDEGLNRMKSNSNIFSTIFSFLGLSLIIPNLDHQTSFKPIFVLATIIIGIRLIQLKQRGLLRPKLTIKALIVVFAALTTNLGLITLALNYDKSLSFLVIILLPLITAVIAFILNIPTQIIKLYLIKKATRKIKKLSKLTTIGITGSYGKSSTKTILKALYNSGGNHVLTTPRNINTEIGVARVILKNLHKGHRTFIAEMGAYKRGDIRILAQMCQPEIGIITAIGEQHLSLMGSIENIRTTKKELVENLRGRKIAILNADNVHCLKIAQELPSDVTVHFFSMNKELHASCKLIDFTEPELGTQQVTIEVLGQRIEATLHLPASYLLSNVLASILAAHLDRIPLSLIKDRLQQINLGKNQISFYETHPGYKVIDDSYNANPVGMAAAINLLNKHAGNKLIITRGLLELGKRSTHHHEEIAKLIFKHKTPCIVLSKSAFLEFQRACIKHDEHVEDYFYFIPESQKVIDYLKHNVEPGSTILLSNRIPESIHKYLKPIK